MGVDKSVYSIHGWAMTNTHRFIASLAIASAAFGAFGYAASEASAAPTEDSPSWSCIDDGNRVCGPGNANGAPAGCYDDGGVLVAPWPCFVVVNADGSADVYVP